MKFTSSIKSWAKTHAIIPLVIGVGSAAFLASCKRNFVTITWKNEDGTVLEVDEKVKKGTMPTYDGETPKKDDTPKDHFTFEKWSPEVVAATESTEYIAVFTSETRKYTVTWLDPSGGAFKTEEVVYGVTPTAPTTSPEKASTAQYNYTFANWNPAPHAVEGNQTYEPVFNHTTRSYTITWYDANGDVFDTDEVEYGQVPTTPVTNPEKSSDAQYDYVFTGWNPAPHSVEGAQSYSPVFNNETRSYVIKFVDYDGRLLKEDTVLYGATPEAPATPSRPSTTTLKYQFAGWDSDIAPVTGTKTYQATYTPLTHLYNIRFLDYDGTELSNEYYEYNANVTPPSNPSHESTELVHTFAGWDKSLDAKAIRDRTYIATYSNVTLEYQKLGSPGDYHYEVVGLNSDIESFSGSIVIPDEYDSWPVTYIQDGAFENKNITGVTIGSYVETIGLRAFKNTKIKSVTIPSSVTRVRTSAFENCLELTSVTFNEGIKEIGESSFENCSIEQLVLPASLNNTDYSSPVGSYAFEHNLNLYEVTVKCPMSKVASSAFTSCGSITEVLLPDGVDATGKLDDYKMYQFNTADAIANDRGTFTTDDPIEATGQLGCRYYTPKGSSEKYLVSSFGAGTYLSTGSATIIKESAFELNTRLEKLFITNTVKTINNFSFDNCASVTSIIFEGNGVVDLGYIGQSAFRNVPHKGILTLPERAKNCNFNQYALTPLPETSGFVFENNVNDGSYKCIDGVLYGGALLHTYPIKKTATEFTVPSNITRLNDYVGISNNNLEKLHFASTTTLNLSSGVVGGSNINSITFEDNVALTLYWYPLRNLPSLRTLVLPANTTCSSMVFNAIGTAEDKPCDVFFRGTNISTWRTDAGGDGTWYRSKAAYCNVYVYSENDPGETAALDHTDGYWHYIDGIPTAW